MARSTQRSTRSSQRQHSPPPPPRLSLSDDEEEDDTDSSDDGMDVDQRARAASSSCSVSDSDKPMDDDLINDPAFFCDISKAATQASQIVAQAEGPLRLSLRKAINATSPDNLQTLYAILLDSVRRSDLLRKEFSEFVPQDMRRSLQVPKAISKTFIKKRAQKFLNFGFEKALDELMNCFDHSKEIIGWNPFAAFADIVEAGAVVRSPEIVQSCSRLTLGADWALLSEEDEKRIGSTLVKRLYLLHLWRLAEIDDLLARWSGKFRSASTCTTCNTDPWEIFLLTLLVGLKKEGTRYVDVETASDTSSESGDDENTDVDMNDHTLASDSDEEDNHARQASDDDDGNESEGDIDPRLRLARLPYDDSEEPPRPSTKGLVCRQRYLRNYGPNAYILRIISMDEFGCGTFKKSPMKVCPDCGFRFDGQVALPESRFCQDIRRAVQVARQQISETQEVIDLP
ncbi:hypothetical protein NDA18_006112 [Ustilago nuda]|nr:hypothetical protein NDA18_006112 [Ustilago nuda]